MGKSYWLRDQKGNFSNAKEDTFDPGKRYVGIRLQQGVPLLDRDWNELEDIRRYDDVMLRRWYVGDGTPDNGFEIGAADQTATGDFRIGAGRCMVDGFEAVNEPDEGGYILYSQQTGVDALSIPPVGVRVYTVYLDLRIEEVTSEDDVALKNPRDVNVETCIRHKLEWRVRVSEGGASHATDEYHHYYNLAEITWKDGKIIEIKDLRDLKLTSASIRALLDELERTRRATINRWIKGGEIEYERAGNEYRFKIRETLCIIHGQEMNFAETTGTQEIKEGENCVILARATSTNTPKIELIPTRKNLLEWLNSWTFERTMPENAPEYTGSVLTPTFTLPLYFFGKLSSSRDETLRKRDLRYRGVLETLLTELSGRLDSRERRMYTVPMLQQTIYGRTVPVSRISAGAGPVGVAFDGAHIWVSNYADNSIKKINTTTDEVVTSVSMGDGARPRGIAFDGAHIWAANSGNNSVTRIDTLTDEIVARIPVGTGPVAIAFDGTHVWVANSESAGMSKIDTTTERVEEVPVGDPTHGVAFDGRHIWAANSGNARISKIDVLTDEVVERIPVGRGPVGVAFDGRHIWVANSESAGMSKIDTTTNKVEEVPTGKNPAGVAFDGTYIWVANSEGDDVSKIDILTDEVVATVDVGKSPQSIAFDGKFLWIANQGSNDVSKILKGDMR
jgi:YVTN family beta-propeller protein